MFDIELGFQRGLDIDIGKYAKAFLFQSISNFCDGGIEGQL